MAHTYMTTVETKSARAMAKDVSISTKVAIEVCNFLRGKEIEHAITILEGVKSKTQAIPFKRFTDGVGHRPGKMGAGRYPVKAATEFLVLFTAVKANATAQGFTGTLVIKHLAANRASRPMRNRSKYRGEFKRTHLEVIVVETEKKAKKKSEPKKAEKPAEKKETPKPEADETPKEEQKPEPKKQESKEKPKPVDNKEVSKEKVEEKPVEKVEEKPEEAKKE